MTPNERTGWGGGWLVGALEYGDLRQASCGGQNASLPYSPIYLFIPPLCDSTRHWHTSGAGANGVNSQTMTITLTRPDLSSDPLLFLRKGEKATLSGSSTFNFDKFDQPSWKADRLSQTITVAYPELTDGRWYISLYNFDKYVTGTLNGGAVRVVIARPTEGQAASCTRDSSCSGHGDCTYIAGTGTTCRCDFGFYSPNCGLSAIALADGTPHTAQRITAPLAAPR